MYECVCVCVCFNICMQSIHVSYPIRTCRKLLRHRLDILIKEASWRSDLPLTKKVLTTDYQSSSESGSYCAESKGAGSGCICSDLDTADETEVGGGGAGGGPV